MVQYQKGIRSESNGKEKVAGGDWTSLLLSSSDCYLDFAWNLASEVFVKLNQKNLQMVRRQCCLMVISEGSEIIRWGVVWGLVHSSAHGGLK